MTDLVEIGITALVSGLLLIVEHYLPLNQWFGKLHPTANYVLGTLALILPLTVLLIAWGNYLAALAIWVVTVTGGSLVMLAYLVDAWQAMRMRVRAAELEAQLLRPEAEVRDAQTER